MQGFDIPKLYLRLVDGNPKYKYEVVDGQQRLRAVWEFFDNQYGLDDSAVPELAGKKYDDFDEDQRMRLEHYQFNLVQIRNAKDDEIREMFCRLQNGKPLNSAEKRNASASAMRDFCAEVARHAFFERVHFSNKRMEHDHVAAQTIALELAGGPTNVQNGALARMYRKNTDFDPASEVAARVRRTYDFLARSFPDKAPELRRGYVVSLYLMASKLVNGPIKQAEGIEEIFRFFALHFDMRRRTEPENLELVQFGKRLTSSADKEESIRFRDEVLRRAFAHFATNELVPLMRGEQKPAPSAGNS
jgi:hypothetical protein